MANTGGGVKIHKMGAWSAGPGCHGGCGVKVHVKDGKLIKVEGDEDHPYLQGRACPRVLAMPQYVNHPDRLHYPLKRVGERGEGKWQLTRIGADWLVGWKRDGTALYFSSTAFK